MSIEVTKIKTDEDGNQEFKEIETPDQSTTVVGGIVPPDQLTAKVAVFKLDGREFIVPGLWYANFLRDDEKPQSLRVQMDTLMFQVILGAKVEWRDFPVVGSKEEGYSLRAANVLIGEIVGRMFKNGAAEVMFLSGPEFDAAAKNPRGNTLVVHDGTTTLKEAYDKVMPQPNVDAEGYA